MTKKIKVLTLSDHPLSPSGVGTQTKYVCQALLDTGRYEVISLGGAIKHNRYEVISVKGYEDSWKIVPVDGYGTQEQIRSILRIEKPDILWFMTDPRFWGWLWAMENEIRPLLPMVYYHVWDNLPYPRFNRSFYLSNDHIAAISKVSYDIVKNVAPEVSSNYIPHAVNENIFKPLDKTRRESLRKGALHEDDANKFIVFWNNRNARRKQSGTLIYWFKKFLDKVGHDKAQLIMHTDPSDPHGQNLNAIVAELGLDSHRQVLFSTNKVEAEDLAMMYNMFDCTVNISDAEGFGLSTLESLACGTPIIVNMTGGLQEQVTNGIEYFGIPLHPTSKAIIGSQEVPYIYEDRTDEGQFVSALFKMYSMTKEDRLEMGMAGHNHVKENYNFDNFNKQWVKLMDQIYNKHKSWNERECSNGVYFAEVA